MRGWLFGMACGLWLAAAGMATIFILAPVASILDWQFVVMFALFGLIPGVMALFGRQALGLQAPAPKPSTANTKTDPN